MEKSPYPRLGRVCSTRVFAAASRRKNSYSLGATGSCCLKHLRPLTLLAALLMASCTPLAPNYEVGYLIRSVKQDGRSETFPVGLQLRGPLHPALPRYEVSATSERRIWICPGASVELSDSSDGTAMFGLKWFVEATVTIRGRLALCAGGGFSLLEISEWDTGGAGLHASIGVAWLPTDEQSGIRALAHREWLENGIRGLTGTISWIRSW